MEQGTCMTLNWYAGRQSLFYKKFPKVSDSFLVGFGKVLNLNEHETSAFNIKYFGSSWGTIMGLIDTKIKVNTLNYLHNYQMSSFDFSFPKLH